MSIKIGIAHPIPNSRFNRCSKLETTINSPKASSVNVNIPGGAPSNLDKFFGTIYGSSSKQRVGRINKCIIGPSTHSTNVDAVEVLNVISVISNSLIKFEKPITYTYSTGDPITLIGAGLPGAWMGGWLPPVTTGFSYGSIIKVDGYSDQYGFDIYNIAGSTINYACLELPMLMADTYYRLEILYRTEALSGSCFLAIYDGSRTINSNSIIYPTNSSSWKSLFSVFKSASSQSLTPLLLLQFSSGSTANKFEIASISLTHASYDHSLVYKTYGVSTIAEYPDMGSIRVNRITESTRLSRDSRGDRFLGVALEDVNLPATRYKISYSLSHVSSDNANIFMDLLDWQQRGYLVNYFPDIVGLPYCLTGRVYLNFRSRFLVTDLTKKSFSFTFEEMFV